MSRGPFRHEGGGTRPRKMGCSLRANGRDVRYDDDLHPTHDLRTPRRPEGPDRWHATTCWRSTRGRPAPAPSSTTAGCGRSGQGQAEVPPDLSAVRAGSSTTRRPSSTRSARQVAQALAEAGIGADRIAAIGLTNQRETTVVWDRADRPGDRPGAGLAGPPDRRVLRAASRPPRLARRADRPGARPLLLGHQDRLAPRPRPRRPPPRRGRRAGRRDRRQPADLAPDRRPTATSPT